jgi:chromosome segregation ATPase
MGETLQSGDIINRAQELETYITQYQVALKALRTMQEEANKIVSSLHQKKDELSHHEQDLVEYLKKLQLVSQKADAVLTPIVDQKQELETLTKKLEEGIASIDGMIEEKVAPRTKTLEERLNAILDEFHSSHEAIQKTMESGVNNLRNNYDAMLTKLSQRIDSCEKVEGSHKSLLEGERQTIQKEEKEITELRNALHELKKLIENQSQQLKSQAQQQQSEVTALMEKLKGELSGIIAELNDKHIKVLEKQSAQYKSTLNALISKLGNVKFKKLLGL